MQILKVPRAAKFIVSVSLMTMEEFKEEKFY